MGRKTAVECFISELFKDGFNIPKGMSDRAKEIEKRDLVDFYNQSTRITLISQSDLALNRGEIPTGEEHFNQTFREDIPWKEN